MAITDTFDALKARFNTEKAKNDKALIGFELSGEDGGSYWLSVNMGTLDVGDGKAPAEPDLILRADAGDLQKILTGQMNPMTAFMSGKVKAERNMGLAMKLMGWFGM